MRSPKSKVQSPKLWALAPALLVVLGVGVARADDFAALCTDRVAVERVYYNHRLGNKPQFAETLPTATLENLVRLDLKKEAVLRKTYGVEISPAMLNAEVQHINTTTRAPEMLTEIKAALGNDTNRFAQTVAKPILVERLLRDKFENDDALHAATRHETEQVRAQLTNTVAEFRTNRGNEAPSSKSGIGSRNSELDQSLLTSVPTNSLVAILVTLLNAGHSNQVSETTWQLTARPAGADAPNPDEMEIKNRFGLDAQIISSPREAEADRKFYFEDMPPELQRVLRVQLRRRGDVSAVIETPGGFLLYVCKEKTGAQLSVACLSLPKRSYEQWLAEQNENP